MSPPQAPALPQAGPTGEPVRLDRIAYQYPDGSVAGYDLHPRLTIVDVHPAHRSALVQHLVSALWTSSPGVHVEATYDTGQAIVAFRPYGGQHRVIDLADNQDVSGRYRTDDGAIDLLRPLGIDQVRMASTAVAGAADLALVDPTDQWVSQLAGHDADRLLDAAHAMAAAERELRSATSAARANPEDAAVIEGVFDNREAAGALEKRHNRVRVLTLVIGSALPIGAVVGLNTIGTGGAIALIGGSVVLAGGCLAYERKLAKAVAAEYRALAAAGSSSYTELDARLEGSPLGQPDVRARLLAAAEGYRTATVAWQGLAGDIPAPWALAQEARLRETAALRAALQPVPVQGADPGLPTSAALLAGLTGRTGALGELGSGEALPLFLDEPFTGLNWADKVPVLEVLGRLSEHQQVVLATDDAEVLSWAGLEAMTGSVAVIDVNPGRAAARAQATTSAG
jgi:hypothetical protein